MRAHYHALEALYHQFSTSHDAELSILDRSLNPRPPNLLYDIVAGLGLGPERIVFELGCGRGIHSCDLAVRFRCRVIGLDPVAADLALALNLANSEQVGDRVLFVQGPLDRVPLPDASLDFIWCRDVIVRVPDIVQGFQEWARLLRPGGYMIVYERSATELMEPAEAARLYRPLKIKARNMSASFVQEASATAGLRVEDQQDIGSELMEYFEERDGRCSRELMRIARMLRARKRFERELGKDRYELALATYHWIIYQVIGKITTMIYTLKKPD